MKSLLVIHGSLEKMLLSSNTFPWSIAIQERQTLLNNQISEKVDLKAYIDYRYNESLNEVSLIGSDSKETLEKKENLSFDFKLVYANFIGTC